LKDKQIHKKKNISLISPYKFGGDTKPDEQKDIKQNNNTSLLKVEKLG
jgi:hypothetical protein